ncbi:unnamed protein product, partial [Prorocentrum cordatum]
PRHGPVRLRRPRHRRARRGVLGRRPAQERGPPGRQPARAEHRAGRAPGASPSWRGELGARRRLPRLHARLRRGAAAAVPVRQAHRQRAAQ